ncbi:protein DOG1-like 3 [Olea europaea var. sylvestris]|uniref:protein DOG1-like 3 n=1 Tax=Olea europaea var. sylvestris TaxID=158386 RepID=UPI000C1CF7AF|nr:protein DOG1-like 3 [Olea europaea var. sylvestris]
MSVLPNSATYMAQVLSNGAEERETFHKFFECWLVEQSQYLEELVSASKERDQLENNGRTITKEEFDKSVLLPLIHRVVQHYEHYYKAKERWAKHNVLAMFNPSWTTSLEDAFLWIGGWRPSMAFHLLYSKSGQQFEAQISELIRGVSTGDLGDISPSQLSQADELQRKTIREEREISEKQAKHQETITDSSMVEMSHAVSELKRGGDVSREGGEIDEGQVDTTLAPKEQGLVEVLQMADELRMKTLEEILNILTPLQCVHFLIAAAELHLRVHEWSKKRDARHPPAGQNGHEQ